MNHPLWFLETMTPAVPSLMGLAAAGFLYVAVADILPGLHQRRPEERSWLQIPLMLAGVEVIALCHSLAGH